MYLLCARWRPASGGVEIGSCVAPKVFSVVVVMQLDGANAPDCRPYEYPVGSGCCPMCAPGLRVFKHCTANSSTTCIPCVGDTYADDPNGSEHCRKCKICDKGTKTTDNVCEACPPGTSSIANMSYSCTPWSRLRENGWVQGEDGNPSSYSSAEAIVGSVLGTILVVAVGLTSIYIWQRKKRKVYTPPVQESGSGQQGQALILTVENEDQTTLPVQETGADPKETRPE
ncbi:tumor necrosis factor receptor superfamily member 14 isoform X5 [Tyto alba]|uniref:tumor necrosis factor receptor superfamily member 14 isoform X5 n=1 Tax=Tyto alba TaxID=56313 RepID=UPI001C67901E|nr:tumor necrosis factor receptor superfamily member 14 isoform X5 [Tyto alba]